MSTRIKWGVLSTAKIGAEAVLPAIVDAANAELVAIGSSNHEKREAIASAYRIPNQYENYEGVLNDPEVQAVYIPLPNTLHAEWVMKAAEAGKHVLVEKPIATSIKEAEDMIQACEKNGVLLMEAFMYQFHPEHDFVKTLIKAGEIGDVRLMRASFTYNMGEQLDTENIRLKHELGGGSIYDVGCYCVHSIRHILETEPEEIMVQANIHPELGVDMDAQGMMKLRNGATAVFDSGFNTNFRETYEVIGTTGMIEVQHAYRPDQQPGGETEVHIKREGEPLEIKRLAGNPYILEVEHVSDCILNNKKPSYSPEQSLLNLKAIQACYASIKSNERIVL